MRLKFFLCATALFTAFASGQAQRTSRKSSARLAHTRHARRDRKPISFSLQLVD